MINRFTSFLVLLMLGCTIHSCKIYSFTGANIDPNIQSVSVGYFSNTSGNGPAYASDNMTNALREKLLRDANLSVVNNNGDVSFEGSITGYSYSIQAPTGNESSDLRRISVTITVSYNNSINPEEGWERQSFTRFADYPVSEDLFDIEEQLLNEITLLLVDDVFNKAFVQW